MVAVSLFWADLHGGLSDEKHGNKELKHPDNLLRRSSYLGRQKVPDHRSKEHRSRRDSTLAIASGAAARTRAGAGAVAAAAPVAAPAAGTAAAAMCDVDGVA